MVNANLRLREAIHDFLVTSRNILLGLDLGDELDQKISNYGILTKLFDDHIDGLQIVQTCYDLLSKDATISNQLSVPISSPGLSREWYFSPQGLLKALIQHYHFSARTEESFSHLYNDLEELFYNDEIACLSYAPVYGLLTNEHTIELSQGLELSVLSDDEKISAYRTGIVKSGFPNISDQFFGIKYRYSAPKLVGKSLSDITEYQEHPASKAEERINRVLTAIHINKAQTVGHPGTIHLVANKLMGGFGALFFTMRPIPFMPYVYELLSDEDVRSLKSFWRSLERVDYKKFKWLDLAVRRFSYSTQRERWDDKFVDLLICAEALFINDSTSKSEQGELKFRLSQRAAFFVETEPQKRKEIFEQMKAAYDMRSAIVHGGTPRKGKRQLSPQEISERAQTIDNLMRTALKKMIGLAVESNETGCLVDWTALIFSLS